MLATTPVPDRGRGPLDKAVAMVTEDQVGRGAAWRAVGVAGQGVG